MKSNRLPTRFRIRAIVPALALVVSVAACSSGSSGTKTSSNTDTGGSTSSPTSITGGTKAKQWTGDPCSLLTASDLSGLSATWDIASTHANPVAGANPECEYQLQGSGTNDGFHASVHVSVDPRDEFTLNKSLFHGTKVSGIGSDAWRGDRDGQANDTIGVQLADLSFRIDAISGLDKNKDDLVALAKAVAARLG
jgi:hypothetical protein